MALDLRLPPEPHGVEEGFQTLQALRQEEREPNGEI
jgi:hypothetical protein